MPKQVTDIDLLKEYISGVMGRADHHAKKVNEISLTLVGAIVWTKDKNPIQVLAREGEMKNVLWVKINGKKYAFSYNHGTKSIDMREDTTKGNLIYSFSNTTPISEVRRVFKKVSRVPKRV